MASLSSLKAKARREGWLRWIRSEADERAVLAGMRFDIERVERVRMFGEKLLRFCEGPTAGQPFTWMDWQYHDLFGPLFGWVKPSEFYNRWVRRYDRVYCQVAKKNGKSPTGAFVGTYMTCGDEEPGAKVFSVATNRDQASIVHNTAIQMVEASPRLMDILKINRTTKSISHGPSNSIYRALASDPKGNEGLNSNCMIVDELHAWKDRTLWDCLKWAFASRPEPILFVITTSGDDTESVCYEQYNYAKSVNRGDILDLGFLGLIYEPDEKDDDDDPATWKKSNPSLGTTIDPSRFAADHTEARVKPSTWAAFRRYRLNRWGVAESAWLPTGSWSQCARDYGAEDLIDQTCYAGLDLATVSDLSSLVLDFPNFESETPEFKTLAFHWLPEATAREYRKRLSIDEWVERGWLELTPGDVTDFNFIRRRIQQVNELFNLQELAFDPWKAEQFTQALEQEDGIKRVEFRQTIVNFAEATSELERLILSQRMHHNRNGLLAWQFNHVKVVTDASGNKRPVKPKPDDIRKIDGVVALIMAHARTMKVKDLWPKNPDDYEVETV